MLPSQYLRLSPRIYPPFQQLEYYATLPESTPPSQIHTPFQQLYTALPESTPPSQNIPPFQQLYHHATLPESIPSSQNIPTSLNNYMRHSQKGLLPPRIHPPFLTNM